MGLFKKTVEIAVIGSMQVIPVWSKHVVNSRIAGIAIKYVRQIMENEANQAFKVVSEISKI